MEDMIAQRRRYYDPRRHCSQKQRPTHSEENDASVLPQKLNAFLHLAPKASHLAFGGDDVGTDFSRTGYHVPALADGKIAKE